MRGRAVAAILGLVTAGVAVWTAMVAVRPPADSPPGLPRTTSGADAPASSRGGTGRARRPSEAPEPVLTVTVRTPAGDGVARASVRAEAPGGGGAADGTTGPDGRAELRIGALGAADGREVSGVVRCEGFAPAAFRTAIAEPQGAAVTVTLVPAATVRVRVVRDDDGSPVCGASVRIGPGRVDATGAAAERGAEVDRAVTGDDGTCAVLGAVPGERTFVGAAAPGFAEGSAWVQPVHATQVATEVRLAVAGEVRGIVTDADGQVTQARVRLTAGDGPDWGPAVHTGEDGRFRIPAVPLDAEFVLHVEPPGGDLLERVVPGVRASRDGKDLSIRLEPPGRLSVRVETLGGAWIDVDAEQALQYGVTIRRVAPLPEGQQGLLAGPGVGEGLEVAPGRYEVRAASYDDRPGGATRVEVRAGEHVTARVPADPAYALTGAVVAAGVPQAGIAVTIALVGARELRRTTTDAEGRFAFPCLSPGTWELEPEHPTLRCTPVRVEAAESAAVTQGRIRDLAPVTLSLAETCEVRLRFPDPAHGRHGCVEFQRELAPGADDCDGDVPDGWGAESAVMGDVEALVQDLGPLAAGRWRIVARVEGFRPWTSVVTLEPGETREFEVGPLDPGIALAGTVVDRDGRPVDRADVVLIDGAWDAVDRRTGPDGRFGPAAAPPGPIELTVLAAGFAPSRFSIVATPGMAPVALRPWTGGAAEVAVRRADGSPAVWLAVRVEAADGGGPLAGGDGGRLRTDARGIFRFRAAPGRYVLRLGESGRAEVRVTDGATTRAVVTIE